jgi:hypothetical protein
MEIIARAIAIFVRKRRMRMQKRTGRVIATFDEKQMEFIKKFAEERCMTKAEAVRVMVDMRRRQEEIGEQNRD